VPAFSVLLEPSPKLAPVAVKVPMMSVAELMTRFL
jgi:hypothetical protein